MRNAVRQASVNFCSRYATPPTPSGSSNYRPAIASQRVPRVVTASRHPHTGEIGRMRCFSRQYPQPGETLSGGRARGRSPGDDLHIRVGFFTKEEPAGIPSGSG